MSEPSAGVNLSARLRERAETLGDAPALVWRGRTLSFAGLEAQVARRAAGLRRRGLGPGRRVLLLHRVSPRLYATLLAVWRVGAAACLVDPGVGPGGFARRVRRLRPDAVHAGGFLLPWRAATAGGDRVEPVDPGDSALLTTTSGTTGTPKGIARSHGLLAAQLDAIQGSLGLRPRQAEQVTLPVFALANLAAGVTSVLAPPWARAGVMPAVAAQARAHDATRCTASPEFFRRALAAGAFPWGRVFTGGAPVWPGLLRAADAAAKANAPADPAAGATLVYGSSEAEPIAELPAAQLTDAVVARVRAGEGLPAGFVVPAATLRVVDPAGGALPAGSAGELEVAGAHVVPGYLDGVGDAGAKRHDGGRVWHRTGDLGRLDADGLLWLLGRAGDAAAGGGGPLPLAVEAAVVENARAAGWDLARVAWVRHAGRSVLVGERGPDPARGLRPETLRLWLPEGVDADEARVVDAIPVDRRHRAKVDRAGLSRLLEAQRPV